MKLIGRSRILRRLGNYAIEEPENKAFFGVKGLGKSALMDAVFSKRNCRQFAEEYHYLYVRTILMPAKKGDDLVDFLIDRVVNGLDLIDDEELRLELQSNIQSAKEKFQSKDSVLVEALHTIQDYDYNLILVMDEFHNMGRNKAVSSEQYDFMRSLNEQGLLYYWIISDSDFSDVYATSQFTTSFFAQKFIPETLPQMSRDEMMELLKVTAEKYEISLSDDVAEIIISYLGGIPGFVLPSIKSLEMMDEHSFDEEVFVLHLLNQPRCASLLTSWCRSLTREQKDLLKDIMLQGKLHQSSCMNLIGKINQLGDNSGLGLIVHSSDENGIFWKLNSGIFAEFIQRKEDEFFSSEITENEPVIIAQEPSSPQTYIQNNYYTVNNNFFNPESAYDALLKIKRAIGGESFGPAQSVPLISSAIQQLPYQQTGWESLEDEEKEDKLNSYADKVFDSDAFHADSLSDSQMQRFFLTPDILDALSEHTRSNLISAIQVYDLLQFCSDRFGLSLQSSESARGILFAKLYESVLKENLRPALSSIPSVASKVITLSPRLSCPFADAPIDMLTIGTFVHMLDDQAVQRELSDVCALGINQPSYDETWWRNHETTIFKIKGLRNECCHSGNKFDSKKLASLIKHIFESHTIGEVKLYEAIVKRI